MIIPFYQASLDAFEGGDRNFNREFDGAERLLRLMERLFHLGSINNGIHAKDVEVYNWYSSETGP